MSSTLNWILLGGVALAAAGIAAPFLSPAAPRNDDDHALREELVDWATRVRGELANAEKELRWVTRETRERWMRNRPTIEVTSQMRASFSADELFAETLYDADLDELTRSTNELILRRALTERKTFLNSIEHQPLTGEQARAVVTTDNRVQVIAAAGSGKTSVMVARAAWALKYGGAKPSEVLLLAYNTAAAEELQHRVNDRLTAAGINPNGVRATTFDALGLDILTRTGDPEKTPRLARWLDDGQDVTTLCRLIDEVRDNDPVFRTRWDLYRLLLSRVDANPNQAEPDGYDEENRSTGFVSMRGEITRSQSERLVADWLFLNGVEYRYEERYPHVATDRNGAPYRPDFYYPELDAWHEHWALGADGRAPADFVGYTESLEWKRAVHAEHGTTLLETTWGEVVDTSGFAPLAEELTKLGITLDWNTDRVSGAEPVSHADMARLMRTFMTHVKSRGHTPETLDVEWRRAGRPYRARLFLDLYWPLHRAWQQLLAADGSMDFEDLLIAASEALENGADMGFTTLLVDEFQDTSPARARLLKGLLAGPERQLLAVGDDWQSINRAGGADIAVMTDFEKWFGPTQTTMLQTTFRCPQSIADTAAEFIQRNPRQLRKSIRAVRGRSGTPVSLIRLANEDEITGAISSFLIDISGRVKRARVDVLGRHEFERDLVPTTVPANLTVTFRTIGSAKGMETDYVVIPRMVNGEFGFPSQVVDDPSLDLALSEAERFAHGEERRLFYVALTRAKQSVALLTVRGHESPFVTELAKAGRVVDSKHSTVEAMVPCPACDRGSLVERRGPQGAFMGCSSFPRCRHTQKVEQPV